MVNVRQSLAHQVKGFVRVNQSPLGQFVVLLVDLEGQDRHLDPEIDVLTTLAWPQAADAHQVNEEIGAFESGAESDFSNAQAGHGLQVLLPVSNGRQVVGDEGQGVGPLDGQLPPDVQQLLGLQLDGYVVPERHRLFDGVFEVSKHGRVPVSLVLAVGRLEELGDLFVEDGEQPLLQPLVELVHEGLARQAALQVLVEEPEELVEVGQQGAVLGAAGICGRFVAGR